MQSFTSIAHCLSLAIQTLFAIGAAVAITAIVTVTREAIPAIRRLLEELN